VRRLLDLVMKDPLLKLTALVLAFLLWALVASEQNTAPSPTPATSESDSTQSAQAPVESSGTVPVAVRLAGRPMAGWEVAGPPRVEPSRVTVTGPPAAVAGIDSVRVPPIRLDGRMASATLDMTVDTAGLGVRVAPARVRVTITIRPISAESGEGGPAERPDPAFAPAGAVP
jgi:YbbR domain-containing protein